MFVEIVITNIKPVLMINTPYLMIFYLGSVLLMNTITIFAKIGLWNYVPLSCMWVMKGLCIDIRYNYVNSIGERVEILFSQIRILHYVLGAIIMVTSSYALL